MVVSDTGPLISAFQSNSFLLLHALLGDVTVPRIVAEELERHGWGKELRRSAIHVVDLIEVELSEAVELAIDRLPNIREGQTTLAMTVNLKQSFWPADPIQPTIFC